MSSATCGDAPEVALESRAPFQPDPLALLPPCSFCWVPGVPGLAVALGLLCAVWSGHVMHHSKGAAPLALSAEAQVGTEQCFPKGAS